MDWTIYSIGDSAFLEQILNAVAMVTGTGDFLAIVKVGFLLGVLSLAFQAIVSGRGIQFQHVLLSLIVWFVMFGPATTVRIEDAYTGSVRVVGNVPLGIAAVGTIISNVGYETTRLFEQGFSVPSMTEYGFGAPLNELGLVRGTFSDPASWSGINDPTNSGDDVRLSWYNYVRECTMRGVQLGPQVGLSEDAIWNTNDPVEALRFDSEAYGTRVYLNGMVQDLDCSDAHDELKAYTDGPFAQAAWDLLTQRRSADMAVTGLTAETAVGDALLALGRAGASAQHYMLANVLMPIYEAGIEGRMLADQQFTAAVMTRQSIEQRNAQWAAEFTLFSSFVRPMMTFMEGFVFALAPVMAFLITLGGLGIKVAGKYFLTLLWIQLWMPTMAIVNLFLVMTVERKLEALAPAFAQHGDVTSLAGASYLFANINSWLATGGMLASSIPVLTLMLVYGGAVTATAMAGRLSKGDYIDEQMVKPSVARPAPALMMGAQTEFSATGFSAAGAEANLPRFDVSTAFNSSVSSASAARAAATETYGHALSSVFSESGAFSTRHGESSNLSSQMAASSARSDQLIRDTVDSINSRTTLSSAEKDTLATMLAFGGGLGIRASAENRFGQERGKEILDAFVQEEASRASGSFARDYREALTHDRAAGIETAFQSTLSQQDQEQLSRAASDLSERSEAYQRAVSREQQFQGNLSLGGKVLGEMLANPQNAPVLERLGDYIKGTPLQGDAVRHAGFLRSQYRQLAPAQAEHVGRLMALRDRANEGDTDAQEKLFDIWGRLTGATPGIGDAERNASLEEATPRTGVVRDRQAVRSDGSSLSERREQFAERSAALDSSVERRLSGGRDAVQEADQRHELAFGEAREQQAREFREGAERTQETRERDVRQPASPAQHVHEELTPDLFDEIRRVPQNFRQSAHSLRDALGLRRRAKEEPQPESSDRQYLQPPEDPPDWWDRYKDWEDSDTPR